MDTCPSSVGLAVHNPVWFYYCVVLYVVWHDNNYQSSRCSVPLSSSPTPRTYIFLSATVVLMCGLCYWPVLRASAVQMVNDTAVMIVFPGDMSLNRRAINRLMV